ncbi:MAG: phage scaffolding protein [Candidatus Aminicenantes bacterium]|nr:phage scaffolding protein [Candidatus Aminicenantes bacterium]
MAKSQEELVKEAADKKAADEKVIADAEAAKKKAEEDGKKVDPTIQAIIDGGADAVQALIDKKRAANEEAKSYRLKLETQEKERSEAEKKQLEADGKFKELAEKAEEEKKALTEKTKTLFIDRALEKAASAEGAIDPSAAAKLADRSKIKIDDAYEVSGAEDAIKALVTSSSYLFDEEKKEDPPPGDGSPKPGLRDKVGPNADDKRSPHTKATSFFEQSQKDKDKKK